MPDQPRHKSRRRTPFQVEPLEGRGLLSAVTASTPVSVVMASTAPAPAQLVLNASSTYVNQQQSSFTVTVSLKKGILIGPKGPQPAAPLDQPLTVDFSASLEQPASGTTDAASPIFAPFHESVTFPAGASTETVTVPIISSAATAGPVTIYLSAAPTSSTSLGIPNGNGNVELYSSPDATPPTFTGVQLVNQGQPVRRRARLQQTDGNGDCGRHPQLSDLVAARDDPPHRFFFGLIGGWSTSSVIHSFPIAAATYDPSTLSVTLTLKRPARASSLYEITSATQSIDMSSPIRRVGCSISQPASPTRMKESSPSWFTRSPGSPRTSWVRLNAPLELQ